MLSDFVNYQFLLSKPLSPYFFIFFWISFAFSFLLGRFCPWPHTSDREASFRTNHAAASPTNIAAAATSPAASPAFPSAARPVGSGHLVFIVPGHNRRPVQPGEVRDSGVVGGRFSESSAAVSGCLSPPLPGRPRRRRAPGVEGVDDRAPGAPLVAAPPVPSPPLSLSPPPLPWRGGGYGDHEAEPSPSSRCSSSRRSSSQVRSRQPKASSSRPLSILASTASSGWRLTGSDPWPVLASLQAAAELVAGEGPVPSAARRAGGAAPMPASAHRAEAAAAGSPRAWPRRRPGTPRPPPVPRFSSPSSSVLPIRLLFCGPNAARFGCGFWQNHACNWGNNIW